MGPRERSRATTTFAPFPSKTWCQLLTPSLVAADPSLANLRQLEQATAWMVGIQIFLTEDVDLAHGHTIYVDSPWALTSISQAQFWSGIDLSQYGNGSVKGIISVDISEWEQKGLNGKTAKECNLEELIREVWEQLKRSLNRGGAEVLKDEYFYHWFMDPDVQLREGAADTNEEPLLVNLVDTWALRPEAVTRIPNLFLAADYVRTYTDLATMEAANEAARRAVNGILKASGVTAAPCDLWKLHEPEILAPWRALDLVRYHQGLPWDDTLVKLGLAALNVGQEAVYAVERRAEARSDVLGAGGVELAAIKQLVYPLTGGALARQLYRARADDDGADPDCDAARRAAQRGNGGRSTRADRAGRRHGRTSCRWSCEPGHGAHRARQSKNLVAVSSAPVLQNLSARLLPLNEGSIDMAFRIRDVPGLAMPLCFCQRLDHFHDHSSIHNAVIVVVVVEVYVGAGDNEERLGGLGIVGRCPELVNRAAGFVEVRARGLRLIGILRVIPFARQREPVDGSGVEMVG